QRVFQWPLVQRHGHLISVRPTETARPVLSLGRAAQPGQDGLFDVAVLAHDAAALASFLTRTRPVRRSCMTDLLRASMFSCFVTSASRCCRCRATILAMDFCSDSEGTGTISR